MLYACLCVPASAARDQFQPNLIPNGDFHQSGAGRLPFGWTAGSPRASLAPRFRLVRRGTQGYLYVSGAGNPDCVGWADTRALIERGKTYWFRVRFRKSQSLNPVHHMLFQVSDGSATQGIGEFHRLPDNRVEGEGRISFPGAGTVQARVSILYRLCPEGEAWIQHVSLTETSPVPPRWVKVACTQGPMKLEEYGLKAFGQVLDAAGRAKVDLALLPEYINGEETTETITGPSAQMMAEKAARYHMYVAGTIGRYDTVSDRLYNSALLFNRDGQLAGWYDKTHLYGPELHQSGVTPGDKVPVFRTDFGKVGFMTCYDSWFNDVAELVALKGADILLFPNLGYDRELLHARSLDNCINVVTSSRSGRYGVWDPTGRDVLTSGMAQSGTYKDATEQLVANTGLLIVTLDLNAPRYPEWTGGEKYPVPRGKRQSGNQKVFLEDQIMHEKQRWWSE